MFETAKKGTACSMFVPVVILAINQPHRSRLLSLTS